MIVSKLLVWIRIQIRPHSAIGCVFKSLLIYRSLLCLVVPLQSSCWRNQVTFLASKYSSDCVSRFPQRSCKMKSLTEQVLSEACLDSAFLTNMQVMYTKSEDQQWTACPSRLWISCKLEVEPSCGEKIVTQQFYI